MKPNKTTDINNFLISKLGLNSKAIELGIKLANKNGTSLPITLWSNSIISTHDLNELYNYIYRTNS